MEMISKLKILTKYIQTLLSFESGEDTPTCTILGHSFYAFYKKCLETPNLTCIKNENAAQITKINRS